MQPSLKIYDAAFQAELKRLLAHMKGEQGPARTLNAEAYHLGVATLKFTRRAKRGSIEALGLKTATAKPYQTSAGRQRIKRTFTFEKDNAIANYLAALKTHGVTVKKISKNLRNLVKRRTGSTFISKPQFEAHGGKQLVFASRAELAQRARWWIAKKLRSIGFLASTWRLVIRKFDRYAKDKEGLAAGGTVKAGRPHDSSADGSRAATGKNPVAVLQLKIGADKYGNELRSYAAKLQRDALQLAINERVGKMQRRMAHDLRERAQAAGFKVTA